MHQLRTVRRERAPGEPDRRTLARTLSLLFGGFASIVSIWVFLTEGTGDLVDWLFLIGFPIAFAVLAYFVGFYHSEDADGA